MEARIHAAFTGVSRSRAMLGMRVRGGIVFVWTMKALSCAKIVMKILSQGGDS